MTGTTPRKSIVDFKEALCDEYFCIIPNELIKRMLDDSSIYNKTCS